MSHYIAYQHLAIRFPRDALRAAHDHWSFHDDFHMLLELGGDNNCTTAHPDTGREVRSREWVALAYGRDYEVVREAVRLAADCEGGGMRLSGQRRTSPECYIRRVRQAMRHPLPFMEAGTLGIMLAAEIPVPDEGAEGWRDQDRELLNRHARIVQGRGGLPHWRLDIGRGAMDAALLMMHGRHVSGKAWNAVAVSGPRFPCEGGGLFRWLEERSQDA